VAWEGIYTYTYIPTYIYTYINPHPLERSLKILKEGSRAIFKNLTKHFKIEANILAHYCAGTGAPEACGSSWEKEI